jgi:hypothetical protein
MSNFNPTHVIFWRNTSDSEVHSKEVQEVEGALYSRREFEDCESSDWSFSDPDEKGERSLLFQNSIYYPQAEVWWKKVEDAGPPRSWLALITGANRSTPRTETRNYLFQAGSYDENNVVEYAFKQEDGSPSYFEVAYFHTEEQAAKIASACAFATQCNHAIPSWCEPNVDMTGEYEEVSNE